MPLPTPSGPVYASALGRWFLPLSASASIAVTGAATGGWLPMWAPIFPLGALFFVVFIGVLFLGSGIFARPLLRGTPDLPLVALTFDDGPDLPGTEAVLSVLRRHRVPATFFVIGARAARHREILAAQVRDGHQIENHSYHHHYDTTFRPVSRLTDELCEASRIIAAATGRAPRWFRPPIGLLSPRVAAAARRAGLRLCGYSCKARDGMRGTTVEQAVARLARGLRPGAILVLHDAAERDGRDPIAPEVVERLVPLLRARGLRPVTLDVLIGEAKDAEGRQGVLV